MTTLDQEPRLASPFEEEVADTQRWFESSRFRSITRLYTARQVVEQRGTIAARLHRRPRGGGGVLSIACASSSRSARASPPSAPTRPARR